MFCKLIAPLDGNKSPEQALPYALRLAQAGDGRIVLMRAALIPDSGSEILRQIAERPLEGVVMATHGRTGLAHVKMRSLCFFNPLAARLIVPLDARA